MLHIRVAGWLDGLAEADLREFLRKTGESGRRSHWGATRNSFLQPDGWIRLDLDVPGWLVCVCAGLFCYPQNIDAHIWLKVCKFMLPGWLDG